MKTFRDEHLCGDLDSEYFQNSKWSENGECWKCKYRERRKLLGGPLPLYDDPDKYHGRGPCCALKPEECCMQKKNPYASSGLSYDAGYYLCATFNVLFAFYVLGFVILLYYTLCDNEAQTVEDKVFRFLRFTLIFWTIPLWLPLLPLLCIFVHLRPELLNENGYR